MYQRCEKIKLFSFPFVLAQIKVEVKLIMKSLIEILGEILGNSKILGIFKELICAIQI